MPFRPFFLPSSELTNELMIAMGRRRAGVLREASKEVDAETAESDELLQAVLAALENEPEPSAEHDWEDQRWVSNIMYHLLGRLAGRARREGVDTFHVSDAAIIDGMRTSLGLYESHDQALLEELAVEFSWWLLEQPNNTYPAGWGNIVRDPYDPHIIFLETFRRNEPELAIETDTDDALLTWDDLSMTVGGSARAATGHAAAFGEVESEK